MCVFIKINKVMHEKWPQIMLLSEGTMTAMPTEKIPSLPTESGKLSQSSIKGSDHHMDNMLKKMLLIRTSSNLIIQTR